MNTQEINIAIANILSVEYITDESRGYLLSINEATGCYQLLDYTTDWNLCGLLVVALLEAGWRPEHDMVRDKHTWRPPKRENGYIVPGHELASIRDMSFLIATCLAFIEECKK